MTHAPVSARPAPPGRPRRLLVASLAALALVVAACAGDDGSPSPSAASPSLDLSPSPSEQMSPSPSDGLASPSGSPAASPSASGALDADVVVTGVEYAYAGMPDSVSAGTTLGFRNDGDEVHEMVVIRKNDGVTQSFEELLALPGETALDFVSQEGVAFALPGQEAEQTVTVDQPGEYLMICFVPVGTTSLPSIDPNASAGASPSGQEAGAPHFTQGMLQLFTVTQ